ncbi:hypothetical protein NDA16_001885 [Ustilago loliicola]|nr:hypothetical protein NDA16_001885 [Ustilago loliicola]
MEYLSRLSGLVTTPAKAAAGITGSPRLRKKPSLHPVGSVDIFHADWQAVQAELESPDERALFFGVARSDLPRRLQRIVDALVFESNRSSDGHLGPCMEYLLKYDILTELVHLSVDDRPKGVRAETIRTLTNLIILLDEKFLSRQAVNKPISQLIQLCLDEDAARFQLDDDSFEASGSSAPADAGVELDYEEDLVELMCQIASRIRNTPDLLQIFFSDEPVDDADDSPDARSLRDGSIIVSRDLFNDTISASKNASSPEPDMDNVDPRPPSPAGSVDSTATIQPSTAYSARKQSKRRLRFPLFSYLLKFVHREGRIGELARAGLLFLISLEGMQTTNKVVHGVPPKKPAKRVSFGTDDICRSLAVFIAHSDFADVLGAGLGAAYGLLPSRIRPLPRYDPTAVDNETSSKGGRATITLASSSASEAPNGANESEALASATQSDDAELQAQLRLLVDLIEFCQDVLDSLWLASKHLTEAADNHTDDLDEKASQKGSSAPATTPDLDPMIRKLATAIAIAIRDTFIRNVIYPSLMESSDFDGSSAAVLNYLDVIVIVLRSGHILTEVAMDFLLPADLSDLSEAGYAHDIDVPVDEADRYTVKDLILDCLEDTKRPATRVAALRLARSLIVCHGFRACNGLLQLAPRKSTASPVDDWMPEATEEAAEDRPALSKVEMHFREIDTLSSLLTSFGSAQSTETLQVSLSNYLLDAEQALRHDSTFSVALDLGGAQLPLVRNDPTTSFTLEEAALNRAERLKSRFWKTVTLQPPTTASASGKPSDGFQILLDKRSIRTPSGQPIVIPRERELLATCIAQEWSEQEQVLKPHTLPLTSLAARALEGCKDAGERKGIEGDLIRYLENETICFQESQPKSLVELQTTHWTPLLSYINSTYSTSITPFTGLLGNAHPPGTLDTFSSHLSKLDPFDLAAFERSVMLTKSFLISLALVSAHFNVEQAAQAAEVEVQSQINRWGAVEDSHDVDQAEMRRTLGSVAIATVRN